jgi:hypothetical protein
MLMPRRLHPSSEPNRALGSSELGERCTAGLA